MPHYRTSEVAELLDWPESRVRGFVRDGLVTPETQGRRYRFGFQDLVLFRATDELLRRGVAARNIKAALRELKHLLPDGRPLSAVRLGTAGDRIVVREGAMLWEPVTGQAQLDFETPSSAQPATPLRRTQLPTEDSADSSHWYDYGLDLEESGDLARAEAAYRKSIQIDNGHADAHINLGRLLQQSGRRAAAESHYRHALDLDTNNAVAHFNLGTLFEEAGQQQVAIGHYNQAARSLPDAHYNLARIFEMLGDRHAAIRHLRALRMLFRR